jgi:hypothetical protein
MTSHSGMTGCLVAWGRISRGSQRDTFDLLVGGVPVGACLLPFDGSKVHVLRVFTESPISPRDLVNIQLLLTEGTASAEMPYQEPAWSEVTPGSYHEETGRVGGHDLLTEISSHIGQYAVLVVSTSPIDVGELSAPVSE